MSNTANRTLISGGTVVTPTTEIENGTVEVSGGKIVSVEAEPHGSPDVDATGKYVLPGLIDLHGDDIERHLFPRAGERVDTEVALDRGDISNASAGITTKYHAIAFEDVPDDNRSIELARLLADPDGLAGGERPALTGLFDTVVEVRHPDGSDPEYRLHDGDGWHGYLPREEKQ